MSVKTISIIGRGDFGELLKELVPEGVESTNYGSKDTSQNIEAIGKSDIVILSIPLQAYQTVLEELAPALQPETLVIDVCSVKVKPAELIKQNLPNHKNILLTHPLFGPQSYHNGEQHTLIITAAYGDTAQIVEEYCAKALGLKVLHMTNEEHDKRMAEIHALTFFVARGLSRLNLNGEPFMTPSFQSLLDLVELDRSQTEALFLTVQNGNPYADDERQKLLESLVDINNSLKSN